jgi:hypothetical protein
MAKELIREIIVEENRAHYYLSTMNQDHNIGVGIEAGDKCARWGENEKDFSQIWIDYVWNGEKEVFKQAKLYLFVNLPDNSAFYAEKL